MRSRMLVAAASGLLGLVALAGCGAGPDAPTAATLPSIPGVDADADGVGIRNARIPFRATGFPAGGDATIELSVVNTGTEPVQLLELISPAAESVTVTSVELVGGQPGAGNPPNGGAAPQLLLPPGGLANATLQATGLAQALDGTVPLTLTLTFDNGAAVAMDVPTAPPDQPLPREPMEFEEAEGH